MVSLQSKKKKKKDRMIRMKTRIAMRSNGPQKQVFSCLVSLIAEPVDGVCDVKLGRDWFN